MKILLTTLNAKYIHSALALYELKAFCDRDGREITIREYSVNHSLLDIVSDIYGEQPEVIGLACYIWNIGMTLELVALLRKVLPECVIILGGPEVSYDGENIMRQNPAADYLIMGEGEESLDELFARLECRMAAAGIEGVIERREGRIVAYGRPRIVERLELLPFPYADEDMPQLQHKILYYESSRGCPFSCQYCLSSATQGVRFLPVNRVLYELAFFIRHQVRQVKFVDRTFNASKEHYLPILRFLAAADCQTNFHLEIAADLLDEETLQVLSTAPAGRFQLEIGVQSTSEDALKEIRRTNHWPAIVRNVQALQDLKTIHLHLDLIAGLPYEDYCRFGQSFDDVFTLRPDMLQLGFLKLLKGSGVRERAEEHGYIHMDTAPYEVLANRYISYREIRSLRILEDVLNQTYNSGRFRETTEWMIKQTDGSFAFFREFAAYWEQNGWHTLGNSVKAVYHHYALYGEDKQMPPQLCLDLLKFDALLADQGRVRPEFLPWDPEKWENAKGNFFREETVAGRYIPGFRFTNWRQVKKQYHIEFFTYDVTDREALPAQRTALLFLYEGDSVRYQKLAMDYFEGNGEQGLDAL